MIEDIIPEKRGFPYVALPFFPPEKATYNGCSMIAHTANSQSLNEDLYYYNATFYHFIISQKKSCCALKNISTHTLIITSGLIVLQPSQPRCCSTKASKLLDNKLSAFVFVLVRIFQQKACIITINITPGIF